MIQTEGRWNSSGSSMAYTLTNPEDAGIVSSKLLLVETGKWGRVSHARVLYKVEHRSIDATSELEYVNGLLQLGVSIV